MQQQDPIRFELRVAEFVHFELYLSVGDVIPVPWKLLVVGRIKHLDR